MSDNKLLIKCFKSYLSGKKYLNSDDTKSFEYLKQCSSIISDIKKNGGDIALTVWDTVTNGLIHRLFTDQTCIEDNAIGIPEPRNGEFIPYELLDIVLVPLLVVDCTGARVGYGKGVYDRFLADCSPKTIFIGLSLFEMIERIEDVDVYDIPLTYCITPTRCINFEK